MDFKIMLYQNGETALVWINEPLDIALTAEEAAAQVKAAWEEAIVPMQQKHAGAKKTRRS